MRSPRSQLFAIDGARDGAGANALVTVVVYIGNKIIDAAMGDGVDAAIARVVAAFKEPLPDEGRRVVEAEVESDPDQ